MIKSGSVHDEKGEMKISGKIVIVNQRILRMIWVIDDLLQISFVT